MFGTEVDTPVQEELVVFCDMIPGVCNVEILPIRDIASAELLAPMFSVVHRRRRPGRGGGRRSAHGHALWLLYGGHAIDGVAPRRRQRSVCAAARQASSIRPGPAGLAAGSATGRLQRGQRRVPGLVSRARRQRGHRRGWLRVRRRLDGIRAAQPPADAQRQRRQLAGARVRRLAGLVVDQLRRYAVPMATNMWASSHPYIVGFTGLARWAAATSASPRAATPVSAARGLGDYGAPEPRSRAWSRPWAAPAASRPTAAWVLTGGGDLLRWAGPEPGPGRLAVRQQQDHRQKPDLDGMVTNRGAIQIEAAPSAARASCSARTPSRSPA